MTTLSAPGPAPASLALADAATLEADAVLARLGTSRAGLSADEAARRLRAFGPNALRSHGARPLLVLTRQLRNPLLILLVGAASVSVFLGQGLDATIIFVIVALSVGLGFFDEYRSERAVQELHDKIRHREVVRRDGRTATVDGTELVPGDLVRLEMGDLVPADLRLLEATDLECDEAVLTGESLPVDKAAAVAPPGDSALDLPSCAFMGTIVRGGTGWGVAVRTGPATEFGRIAMRLGERHAETSFERGLRDFSKMLVVITGILVVSIFGLNVVFHRRVIEALLFSLAIAIGLTPQLLPAIVTISLATGSRRLARRKVIVKRLVSIEDLGNVDVLLTDKTGTLTEGRITFSAAIDPSGAPSPAVLALGLLCNEAVVEDGHAVGGNPLDQALWDSPDAAGAPVDGWRRIAVAPFDHDRRMMSVLVEDGSGRRRILTKGAPESVLAVCTPDGAPAAAHAVLDEQFAAGSRVVAVASRDAARLEAVSPADKKDLSLDGFLTFVDRPKADAGKSIARLAALGVEVKIITGDNDRVAQKVCADLGLAMEGTLTGARLDDLSDDELAEALPTTTIFARVSPEQKGRVLAVERRSGRHVAFLGDGVNDAVGLHSADVGISVETATDVAKDAADVVLLDKDLGVLADGVVEGRRIFANTIKYVLMATSSNFGNMFSAAGASVFLKFLPMLPSQILLNNLLYDISETTIPSDTVDEELLQRPAHWDLAFIRKFMAFFGPISSAFDFLTFGVLLWVLDAGPRLFRSGWFVESLATQTLVIFVIRTRRRFYRSRPSRPLAIASLSCVAVGVALPFSPLAHVLGFRALPLGFLGLLVAMVAAYLALAELGKTWFFRPERGERPLAVPHEPHRRRVERVASRWSHREQLVPPSGWVAGAVRRRRSRAASKRGASPRKRRSRRRARG